MEDPVITADGHTYDRAQIERWLRDQATSPITGEQLQHKNLVPNHSSFAFPPFVWMWVCLFMRVPPVIGFERETQGKPTMLGVH